MSCNASDSVREHHLTHLDPKVSLLVDVVVDLDGFSFRTVLIPDPRKLEHRWFKKVSFGTSEYFKSKRRFTIERPKFRCYC